MKTFLRWLIAGAALLASTAFADVTLPNTGNGELVLFVRNVTTGATYGRGLGITLNQLLRSDQIAADGSYTRGKGVATNIVLTDIAADTNLSTFLNTTDTFQWTLMGGAVPSPATDVSLGAQRFVTASQLGVPQFPNSTNSNLSNYRNVNATMNTLNNSIAGTTPGDGGSAVGSAQWWAPTLNPNPQTWYGIAGMQTTNPLGTTSAANFYLVASSGNGNTNPVLLYSLGTVTLSSNGTLHFTPADVAAVPVPAAVWLLGSGLVGLAGIGRRRLAVTA
jgi:hypothetical protein